MARAGRLAPVDRSDAIYERLVEIQERQQAINEQQIAASAQRDRFFEKLAESVNAMARLLESRSDVFERIEKEIEARPHIVETTAKAVKDHVDEKIKSLAAWLALATFAGSAAGNSVKALVDWAWRITGH